MSSVGTSIETNITSVEYPNLYVDALVDLDTNAVLAGKKGSSVLAQVYWIGDDSVLFHSIKKEKLIITPYKPVFRTVSQNRPKRYVDALVDLKTDVIIAGKKGFRCLGFVTWRSNPSVLIKSLKKPELNLTTDNVGIDMKLINIISNDYAP